MVDIDQNAAQNGFLGPSWRRMGERLEPSGIATRPQKVKVLGAKTGQFEQLRENVGNSIAPKAIGVWSIYAMATETAVSRRPVLTSWGRWS